METLTCQAMAFSNEVALELLRNAFEDFTFERGEEHSLKATGDGKRRVFIYRFRAIVLIGFSVDEIKKHQEKVRSLISADKYLIEEDDFSVITDSNQASVRFNAVELPRWDEDLIEILAQVLARSTSLSIVEREVNSLIEDSSGMTSTVGEWFFYGRARRQVHEHLQDVYQIRHRLILQLSLLRAPDHVWEDEQSEKVYKRLVENFDFLDRLDGVERTLELSSDVARFQLEVMHMRRSEILEIIIILLILVEVVHTFIPSS
ncbi:MAG: RMD1 family protein [Bdellovibrionales bacterium]|nr:RMD1 family protein [Bdellovibrionales bacterium]